jgi:hypothetical protein
MPSAFCWLIESFEYALISLSNLLVIDGKFFGALAKDTGVTGIPLTSMAGPVEITGDIDYSSVNEDCLVAIISVGCSSGFIQVSVPFSIFFIRASVAF